MAMAQLFREHIATRNDTFSHTHKPSISFAEFPNTKAMMILSCMDPRANPNEIFDFHERSPIVPAVLRNAGGRVTEDVLRSIRTIAGIMGNGENTVGLVAVVHHEDCGLRTWSDKQAAEKLIEHVGLEAERAEEVRRMDFGSMARDESIDDAVLVDMKIVKADPYLPKDLEVIGYVYDSSTGKVREVAVM